MAGIFDIEFRYELQHRDNIVYKFSKAQGVKGRVFTSHWQCFAWAAVVGFLSGKPTKIEKTLADRSFSLRTMKTNGGERIAEALVCLCIAKAGTVEILKTPEAAVELINEYANTGFYILTERLEDNPITGSDLQWVLQEIFSRKIDGNQL